MTKFGNSVGRSSRWPVFDADEIQAAVNVLESGRVNYWTGEEVCQFEAEFSRAIGSEFSLALANGTLALDVALRAIALQPGDEVVVTPRSFIASVSSVALLGGVPLFVDVDRDSQNISLQTIESAVTKKTKAILVVHHAGWPCDMESICEFAATEGIAIIEDCAQAHGAFIGKQHVGTFGDVGVFSFCQDKIMTTAGEGGMLVTNNREIFETARSFKDHGKNFDRVFSGAKTPGFRLVHDSLGSNYRMTEFQAAIGRAQLKKLGDWSRIRNQNAEQWVSHLAEIPGLRLPMPGEGIIHAFYKFYAFLESSRLRPDWNRDRVLRQIVDQGVDAFTGSCPEIYAESAFDAVLHLRPEKGLSIAKELGTSSLMFLVDPTIDQDYIASAANVVRNVLAQAVG